MSFLHRIAAAAQEAEADWERARDTVGEEAAQACLAWAQTTIIPNHEAFAICWRAGGPQQAEASPSYQASAGQWLRRIHRR